MWTFVPSPLTIYYEFINWSESILFEDKRIKHITSTVKLIRSVPVFRPPELRQLRFDFLGVLFLLLRFTWNFIQLDLSNSLTTIFDMKKDLDLNVWFNHDYCYMTLIVITVNVICSISWSGLFGKLHLPNMYYWMWSVFSQQSANGLKSLCPEVIL